MTLTIYLTPKETIIIEHVTYHIYFAKKNTLEYYVVSRKFKITNFIGFAAQEE